ncbi:hypothetical protein [Simiduia agarivorans]|uniref:Uncharacterized protein n=1 Tax=Simiduia agarivorans (strain DSM 21679 / JCM 13881 / BCRC 17597 / SA1) TaxID=1117647 RepID=K4KR46_SIMAS|nr:hypothetical protein [Simiduia agarivorans]AFV00731.2 hypothetical protein M5M_18010 [Simiduia agarivorans SA1 = DSM 21679]
MSELSWDCAINATALDQYLRQIPSRPQGRYGFWLLGVVVVLACLVFIQVPDYAGGRVAAQPLALVLVQPAPPTEPSRPLNPIPPPAVAPSVPSVPETPTSAETEVPPVLNPAAAVPALSLSETRARLMQDYQRELQDTTIELTGNGATVMDSGLRQKLNAIAAAPMRSTETVSTLPDAMGQTQVEFGDHCFVTSELDNQAMRGMKNWWVGLCGKAAKSEISLEGIKVLGAP